MRKMLLTLLCAVITTTLWAASPVVGDTLRYEYKGNSLYYKITKKGTSNEVTIVSDGTTPTFPYTWSEANKPVGALVIPNTIKDAEETEYMVTDIQANALRTGSDKLTSIDFSENTYIRDLNSSAFQGCNNVTSITLSDRIYSIVGYCFEGCKLTSIDFKNVRDIGMANFTNCNIASVHLPKTVKYIADQSYLFKNATTITIDEENTTYTVVDNVLYTKDMTRLIAIPGGQPEVHIAPSTTSALHAAMREYLGTIYLYSQITHTYHGWSDSPKGAVVVNCGLYEFYTTGDYAGAGAGSGDFMYITSLTEKLLYEIDVVAINGSAVFNDTTNCNEVKVTVTADPGYTFVNWSDGNTDNPRVVEVTSDTTVTANIKKNLVPGDIFYAPTVEGVSVWYKVLTNEVGDKTVQVYAKDMNTPAISKATTGAVTIPDSAVYFDEKFRVVALSDYAFRLCEYITELNLPNTITKFGRSSVYECTSVTKTNIPNQLVELGRFNYAYFNSLTEITIPATVKYVGYGCFTCCPKLATINGWNPSQYERVGANVGTMNTKYFTDNLVTEEGFKYSGDVAMGRYNNEGVATMAVRTGTRIVTGEIANQKACENITLPATVIAIGNGALGFDQVLKTCTIQAVTPPLVYDSYNVEIERDASYLIKSTNGSGETTTTPADVKYYVPKSAIATYKASDKWNMLDLRPIGGWTITFVDHDGESTQQVEQGEMPIAPTPAVYYTAEHMYVFDHWDVTPVAATEDATYTAVYAEQELPKYYVCFYATEADALAHTNRILRVEKERGTSAVENGVVAAAKLDPRACEMVTDWNGGDLSNVTSELHVWPVWGTGQYTVVFYVEATAVKTLNNVECGDLIEAPTDFAIPTGKIFVGWDSDAWQNTDALIGNLDIHAVLKDDPSGLGNVQSATIPCSKVILDGQLFIQRGDELFNAQGTRVK